MLRAAAVLAIAGFVLPRPAAAQEMTLEDVLDHYYEAIGGVEAWNSIKSMKVTGKMTMRRGMEVPFTRLVKRPDKVRMEFTMQGMTGVRAFDGEAAWMLMPFRGESKPQPIQGGMARGLRDEADIGGPLVGYRQKGNTVELAGLVESEGTRAYRLEVTLADGRTQTYYLDAEYFLPIKIESRRATRGNEVEVETIISDYKEVDGLMMAHSFQTRPVGVQGGRGGQTITIERVELNPDIPDAVFAMPEGESGS